jgi:integrase
MITRAAALCPLGADQQSRRRHSGRRWVSNPRDRFLTPAEVRTFWTWLEGYDVDSGLAPALRLMLATGQRSEEILRISAATYEPSRALVFWKRTKNGLPHSLPLPHQAVAILAQLAQNRQSPSIRSMA